MVARCRRCAAAMVEGFHTDWAAFVAGVHALETGDDGRGHGQDGKRLGGLFAFGFYEKRNSKLILRTDDLDLCARNR